MGKKKKLQRGQKPKKPTPISNTPPIESVENEQESSSVAVAAVAVNRDSMLCSHIEKGINLDILSNKIGSTEIIKCNDCGGGKSNRLKGKKSSKSIWVCLECGNFSCGGVGLPNTPQSHAVRHSKQCRHALAVHYVNHQLIYCFKCDRIIAGRKSEEFGVHKDVLNEVSKRMKSGESESVDVEDVWFGSGKIGTKTDYSVSASSSSNYASGDVAKGYGVRGLVNLGNTCFFNSVLQNLLAIESLRDYFVNKMDASVGPLSASLKKLFLETGGEGAVKGTVNPRALFGNVCSKAPMFKGFQQQDSHELLRFLMDGLSNEELKARKRDQGEEEVGSSKEPTFVDAIFGGKLVSIVTCLECRVSSTSYEPFLDLSLSFPSKKSQSVKQLPVTRGKKSKLPPRRSTRIRNKNNSKEVHSFPVGSVSENSTGVSDKSTGGNSSGEVEPRVQEAVQSSLPSWSDTADSDAMALDMGLMPRDPSCSDKIDANDMALDMGLTPQDLSTVQSSEKPQQDMYDNFWLDCVEPTTQSEEIDTSWDHDVALQIALESSIRSDLEHVASEKQQNALSDSFAQLDFVDPTPTSNEIGICSENDGVQVKQSTSENVVLHNNVSQTSDDSGIDVAEASVDNANQLLSESLEQDTVAQHQTGVLVDEDEKNQITQPASSQLNIDLVHSTVSCDQLSSDNSNNCNENLCQKHEVAEGRDIKEDMSSTVQVSNRDSDCLSAAINDEHDSSNFGLGDMFNEPESTIEVGKAANAPVMISSDSDPGEVDNANAAVSVESCLHLYIKTEHLSKDEHAWQCDNCSKILREQMIKANRKPQTHGLEILPNECDGTNGVVDANYEKSLPQTSELHQNGNSVPETELNVITCQPETEVHNKINAGDDICDPEPNEEDANSEKLKVSRDATKRFLINKAPSILTITLKRFLPDARGRMSKVNGHVIFGQTMDLKPYMDPRCLDRDSYRYQLVGVVEHSGTMRGGHYVAYVRGGTSSSGSYAWYNVSDVYVRQVSLEEVLASEAYILFYELI